MAMSAVPLEQLLGLTLLLLGVQAIPGSQPEPQRWMQGRLCVEEGTDCSRLRRETTSMLTCVPVRDRLDCLRKMEAREADIGYFEAEDLSLAALFFNDSQNAVLQVFTGQEVQSVYLLVRNASNPNPKTMCHPGLKLQRSYPRALYRPVTLSSDWFHTYIETHFEALSRAWEAACIPGPWSLDPATDQLLKQHHPHLCKACVRHNCDAHDPYAGEKVLDCLLDHAADAAFVSDVDFRRIRSTNLNLEEFSHYCSDGRGGGFISPLRDRVRQGQEPCDWGKRPLPVLMFREACDSDSCRTHQRMLKSALIHQARTVVETLQLPPETQITLLDQPLTPSGILKKAGYTVRQEHTKTVIRFCVHDQVELAKCQDLAKATAALGLGEGVGIGCLLDNTSSRCFPKLYFGNADVLTLDGGDVYQATKDFGFQRILSEVYDTTAATPTSSYYAVAVVKADSNITSFRQLEGRKSCHTGIGKTAGWKMPVATLLDLRLISPQHCNYVNAIAEFFTGGSCAPGAKNNRYNKQKSYSDRLCSLCVGTGDNHCARGSVEPFYSYTGAFRCLVHGGGDVAFVKHTTVPDNTDGANTDDWAVALRSDEFKLLCPSHDTTSTAAIGEFQTCNLALVPAHEVVVSGKMPEDRKRAVRQVLLSVSEVFGEASSGHKMFRLFGKYQGKSDLLFKDSAKALKALSEDTHEERQRKKNYFKKLDELHSCKVHVCALEEQMANCQDMKNIMNTVGQQFECVSARDRLDCVRRVTRRQVDMTILSGSYLNVAPSLRIIAYSRDPLYAREKFRYKAVVVVRRSTVNSVRSLIGKKSCHTGYGRTTGWRIPLSLLMEKGVIQRKCEPHKSTLENEIMSVNTTFSRSCVPGEWATSPDVDAELKLQYHEMCSMCSSRTCDKNDDYAGYEGALRCLTLNGGDVAFSKLRIAQEFFADNRATNASEFGLMCWDGRIIDITSENASECFWAARPWDTYVTHGEVSDAKIRKLRWALLQAKTKGEEDLDNSPWYSTTLGIDDVFHDLLPAIEKTTIQDYMNESRMDMVLAGEVCPYTQPVRYCVTSNEEQEKCEDLAFMLKLRGVSPELQCKTGNNVDDCLSMINLCTADVITLDDSKRLLTHKQHSLSDLLSETYEAKESNLYYFFGVIKKGSGINSVYDLNGTIACNVGPDSTGSNSTYNDLQLSNCLAGENFFQTFTQALLCLKRSNKHVAFVKRSNTFEGDTSTWDADPEHFNAEDFELLCEDQVMPVMSHNVEECNFRSMLGNTVVARESESTASKENTRHLFLKASRYFGKSNSFFRLFYNYFGHKDLLFKDSTVRLARAASRHHRQFVMEMLNNACNVNLQNA